MNMATKNVYINSGDLVAIHVVSDDELPNKNGFEYTPSSQGQKYLLNVTRNNIIYNDPSYNVGFQQRTGGSVLYLGSKIEIEKQALLDEIAELKALIIRSRCEPTQRRN